MRWARRVRQRSDVGELAGAERLDRQRGQCREDVLRRAQYDAVEDLDQPPLARIARCARGRSPAAGGGRDPRAAAGPRSSGSGGSSSTGTRRARRTPPRPSRASATGGRRAPGPARRPGRSAARPRPGGRSGPGARRAARRASLPSAPKPPVCTSTSSPSARTRSIANRPTGTSRRSPGSRQRRLERGVQRALAHDPDPGTAAEARRRPPHRPMAARATRGSCHHAAGRPSIAPGAIDRLLGAFGGAYFGRTTAAEPPPRRSGSAAATNRLPRRISIPVAAPISPGAGGVENRWPRTPARSRPSWESMNACSAWVVGAVALDGARQRDRPRQRLAQVDAVDDRLQHRADDRRAARRAERQVRLALAVDDRRRHRAARALGPVHPVRMGRGVVVEVRQLVVEQEPVARHGHGVAAGRLDRERVGDHGALAVGDRDVRGRLARVRDRRAVGGRPRRTALVVVGIARRRRGSWPRCRRSARAARWRTSARSAPAPARRRTPDRRGRRCGRRTRSARPPDSGAGSRCARPRAARSRRGCSAPRRSSCRPRTAGPSRRRSARGSASGSEAAPARCSAAGPRRSSGPCATCGRRSGRSAGSPRPRPSRRRPRRGRSPCARRRGR